MFLNYSEQGRFFQITSRYRSYSIKSYVQMFRFYSKPVEKTDFFSLLALKDVLERSHYNCWHLFVKACFLLCSRSITTAQLAEGDQYLIEFCKRFSELYRPEQCTINMHLHGHLIECINPLGAAIEKRNLTACATLVINCV